MAKTYKFNILNGESRMNLVLLKKIISYMYLGVNLPFNTILFSHLRNMIIEF